MYEAYLLSDQEQEYEIEKVLIKNINTQSTKAIQAINNKIHNFLKKGSKTEPTRFTTKTLNSLRCTKCLCIS